MSWVNDTLFDLIGMSEGTTIAYLIAMAKEARSVE